MRHILWNLSLAAIPVALGYLLGFLVRARFANRAVQWLLVLPLIVLWLAFVPNTCYLLTEWRHLLFDPRWSALLDAGRYNHVAMYRTAEWAGFFLVYSGLGVLLFTLSIRPMEHWLQDRGVRPYLIAPFFFLLVSLGVYLGLIVRLNSWEFLDKPRHVWDTAVDGVSNRHIGISIVVFAALLWGLYEAVDIWVDGVSERLQRWHLLPAASKGGKGAKTAKGGKSTRRAA